MSAKNHGEEIEHGGRRDWNAKLAEFFVGNHRLVILIAVAIIFGGTFSLLSLQREGFPDVPLKMLMVQTVYPGAGSEEVERQITKPLEDALDGTDWVDEISSSSMNSFSNIVVELDQKADIDQATQEIRNKLSAAETDLPEDAEKPEIRRLETGSLVPYILGVSNVKNVGSVARTLEDELGQINGVKSVGPMVEKPVRVIVEIDPEKLAAAGLRVDQLTQIIKGANVDFPVARVDLDRQNQSLVVAGALKSTAELREIALGPDPRTGKPIRLENVAAIKTEPANSQMIDRFGSNIDGRLEIRRGVLLKIDLNDDADVIRTRDVITDKIEELRRDGDIPKKARLVFVHDDAVDNENQVQELMGGAIGDRGNLWLLGGIQLVLIAMLLFVNFRAALLAALAIPLSLGFTFVWLQLAGLTLNTVVLFSLVLVLGLIVDPAIVVVESIQRYRDLGYTPRQAIQGTARRYGAGIFMATLTNWIVFVPFGVVSGIFGEIIRYIPLTVIPAVVASYFIPMAILPWLSEKFLKARPVKTDDEIQSLWGAARFMMAVNRWLLDRWWRQVLLLLITIALTAASINLVVDGSVQIVQFAKPDDNEQLIFGISFAKGLTDKERNDIAKLVEERAESEGAIKSFFYVEQNRDSLQGFARLTDDRRPKDKSKRIADRLERAFKDNDDYEVRVTELGYGPPESDYKIKVQLYDNNLDELKSAAVKLGNWLKKVDGVEEVDDGVGTGSEPEARIVLDRSKAEARGLNGFQVGTALKTLFDDTKITKFDDRKNDRSLDVLLRVDGDSRPAGLKDLGELTLTDPAGRPVRLDEVAKITRTQGLAKIDRFSGRRYITVQARVDDGKLIHIQRRLDRYLDKDRLKDWNISGKGNRGEFEEIANSFEELFVALAIAIGLTYLVLVLQFRSFAQPLIMLFTIPPSLIGVFPALWFLRTEFGFLELLGITILVGIVENVAIFLIDYANQLVRQEGLDPKEAIILASGVRFRPIILTKLVAFGSLLPLAIESPFWRGLSVTIIAGIGLSGLFSMVIIPILFMLIVRVEKRLGFDL